MQHATAVGNADIILIQGHRDILLSRGAVRNWRATQLEGRKAFRLFRRKLIEEYTVGCLPEIARLPLCRWSRTRMVFKTSDGTHNGGKLGWTGGFANLPPFVDVQSAIVYYISLRTGAA